MRQLPVLQTSKSFLGNCQDLWRACLNTNFARRELLDGGPSFTGVLI